ncbi:hypothetical protein LguiA_034060 [Lonicera macranthoides]
MDHSWHNAQINGAKIHRFSRIGSSIRAKRAFKEISFKEIKGDYLPFERFAWVEGIGRK